MWISNNVYNEGKHINAFTMSHALKMRAVDNQARMIQISVIHTTVDRNQWSFILIFKNVKQD